MSKTKQFYSLKKTKNILTVMQMIFTVNQKSTLYTQDQSSTALCYENSLSCLIMTPWLIGFMAVKKCTCKPILKLIVSSNTMFCVHYLARGEI